MHSDQTLGVKHKPYVRLVWIDTCRVCVLVSALRVM